MELEIRSIIFKVPLQMLREYIYTFISAMSIWMPPSFGCMPTRRGRLAVWVGSWETRGFRCGSFVASLEELFDQAVEQAQRYWIPAWKHHVTIFYHSTFWRVQWKVRWFCACIAKAALQVQESEARASRLWKLHRWKSWEDWVENMKGHTASTRSPMEVKNESLQD